MWAVILQSKMPLGGNAPAMAYRLQPVGATRLFCISSHCFAIALIISNLF